MSKEREQFVSEWFDKLQKWQEKAQPRTSADNVHHSGIKPIEPPIAPHLNERIRLGPEQIDLRKVWSYINKKSLFVLSWGIRGKAAKGFEDEAERLFEIWKENVENYKLFEPSAVYGYFRCHNRNGKLVVDLPNNESVKFDFPRSSHPKYLCLTDYFGDNDIAAFQAVTVGERVGRIIDKWNKENRYTDAYYLHGLAVETAEALAEWLNFKIRDELGIGQTRGLRYSWGYPSCPDIGQHREVWKILEPEKSGMRLTEAGQIIPDQSTAAIIVHHPEAEYFTL
jgi:5-methyltetrahydrofolate--homocysteine methyltransferase